jgi:hypothetical protein
MCIYVYGASVVLFIIEMKTGPEGQVGYYFLPPLLGGALGAGLGGVWRMVRFERSSP